MALPMRNICGIGASDRGSFRASRREDLLALEMRETTHGWSVRMMVKSVRVGYRCRKMPARYRSRIGVSKMGGTLKGGVLASVRIISTTLRYPRWRLREVASRPAAARASP